MKAILEIELPNTCVDCKLLGENSGKPFCAALEKTIGLTVDKDHFIFDRRVPECPLKPIQDKKMMLPNDLDAFAGELATKILDIVKDMGVVAADYE